MKKSRLFIPLGFLYIGIFMIVSPSLMFDYSFRESYHSLLRQFGGILTISGVIYYFFVKLNTKLDGIDSRIKELDRAGVDKIKIENKNSFRYVFDDLGDKNFVVDLKLLLDIENLHENFYFIRDFLKNKRFDTNVILLISKPDGEEYERQIAGILKELAEVKNYKTNKNITLRITKDRLNFNAIFYDSNIWLIFNGKREFEKSINLNTRANSSMGKQAIDFFEAVYSKSLLLEEK